MSIKIDDAEHGMSLGTSFAMAISGSMVSYAVTEHFMASAAIGVGATAFVYCVGNLIHFCKS